MRLFEALNSEHLVLYFWPTLAFVVVFAVGLAFMHARRRDSDERLTRIIEEYPGGHPGPQRALPARRHADHRRDDRLGAALHRPDRDLEGEDLTCIRNTHPRP